MAKSDDLDPQTKARIAAHLRRKMEELGLSKRGLALQIGITPPSLVKILNATRNVGTAVLVKIHRRLHIDLNQLVDIDPPRRYFDQVDGAPTALIAAEPPSPPYGASPSAEPGRRGDSTAAEHHPRHLNRRSAKALR